MIFFIYSCSISQAEFYTWYNCIIKKSELLFTVTVIACFANLYYYGNLLSLLPGSGNLRFWGYILFSPKLENIWLPKLCFSKKTHILYILTRADQLIVMKWTFVHLYIYMYHMDLNYVVLQLSQFITCKTCVKTSSGWFRKIPTQTQKFFFALKNNNWLFLTKI